MNSQPQSQLTDFPDWLSPLVVKDLRRGLRQRMFPLTFIALLVAMSLVFISLVISEADSEFLQGMWVPISVVFLLLQPARGLNAIVEERKLGTLSLMQVTGMSSFRIVFGKWASLSVQTLLFTTALVPYLVLGHFLGGFEFLSQLLTLLAVVLQSLIFTAVAVSLSAIKSTLVRVIVCILLFLFGLQLFSVPVGLAAMFAFSSQWALQSAILICAFFGSVFLIYFTLSLGASRLAIPGTENYSTVRRLLAIIFVLLLVGLLTWNGLSSSGGIASGELMFLVFISGMFWGMVALDCLTDPFVLNDKLTRQMKRWPRILAWLLSPGWPFGWLLTWVSFLLILGSLALQIPWWQAGVDPAELEALTRGLIAALSLFSLVVLPAWLALRVEQSRGTLLGIYFCFQLAILTFSGLISGIFGTIKQEAFMTLTPLGNLIFLGMDGYEPRWALISALGYFVMTCALFFWKSAAPFASFQHQLRSSPKLFSETAAPSSSSDSSPA